MNQCTAKSSRTGKRCAKASISGGSVCRTHGGGAPQVKAKARERLLEMVDPALVRIRKLIDSADSDSTCLAACKAVLDRVPELNESGSVDVAIKRLIGVSIDEL